MIDFQKRPIANAAGWAEIDRLREQQLATDLAARAMKAALRQWKCGPCGGSGTYHQNAKDSARKAARGVALSPRFNPPPVPCKACGGSGLHKTAQAAIAQADAAGIGDVGQIAQAEIEKRQQDC